VYVVLGMLYESLGASLTILSTLPSAGWARAGNAGDGNDLRWSRSSHHSPDGIVKKNAILMIDFALEAERQGGLSPEESIYQAADSFRPIMDDHDGRAARRPAAGDLVSATGSELRRPLGIAVVGGPARIPNAHSLHDASDFI